jgi:hypothetical protein
MFEQIFKIFGRLGTIAGWFVAIIQVPVWIYSIINAQRKKQALKIQIQDLENEYAENRDLANQWWQMLKELLMMTKHRCPTVYSEFTDFYGGEEEFKGWWILPNPPEIRKKIYEEEE